MPFPLGKVLILLLIISCASATKHDTTHSDGIIVNPHLTKTAGERLEIDWTGIARNKYGLEYFADSISICRMDGDTLFLEMHQGFGPSNYLEMRIHKDSIGIHLAEYDCTYGHHYTNIQQSLELNTLDFKLQDTLIGHLYYQATFVWDSTKNIADTAIISGKFKVPIHSKFYTTDSLRMERNIKEMNLIFSNERPDTITHLDLSNCGLRTLPHALEKFQNLEYLRLDDNHFQEADFSLLCSMKNLKELQLRRCQLKQIPPQIFCLTQLKILDVFRNEISVLPKEIAQFRDLEVLQLGSNLLAELPPELFELKKLRTLEISGAASRNSITRLPEGFFDHFPHLEEFYAPSSLPYEEYKAFKEKTRD